MGAGTCAVPHSWGLPSSHQSQAGTHRDKSLHAGLHTRLEGHKTSVGSGEAQGLWEAFLEEAKAEEGQVVSAECKTYGEQSRKVTQYEWPGVQGMRVLVTADPCPGGKGQARDPSLPSEKQGSPVRRGCPPEQQCPRACPARRRSIHGDWLASPARPLKTTPRSYCGQDLERRPAAGKRSGWF